MGGFSDRANTTSAPIPARRASEGALACASGWYWRAGGARLLPLRRARDAQPRAHEAQMQPVVARAADHLDQHRVPAFLQVDRHAVLVRPRRAHPRGLVDEL